MLSQKIARDAGNVFSRFHYLENLRFGAAEIIFLLLRLYIYI